MNNQRITIVTSAFIPNSQGQFLFAKRADDDSFLPGFWELPGGKAEFGENVNKAVKREVQEEVGLIIELLGVGTVRDYMHESDRNRQFIELFFVSESIKDQSVSLSHEHSDYKWITFEEAKTIHTTPYILNVLEEIQHHSLVQSLHMIQ